MTALVIFALAAAEERNCAEPLTAKDALTRPPDCPPLDDDQAASHVDRTRPDIRAQNTEANHRHPTAEEIGRFRAKNDFVPEDYAAHITGAFTGTTDDIIEWAAWKWGIDEDVLRAQAMHESDWLSAARGDEGLSIGVMQIKRTVHKGTFPLSAESTAFNLDYYGAVFRYYYDGRATWLNDVEHGQPYEAGDEWGTLGAHFAGRWYTPAAEAYIATVRRVLAARRWAAGA